MGGVVRKIRLILPLLLRVVSNYKTYASLPVIDRRDVDNYVLSGISRKEASGLFEIYRTVSGEDEIDIFKRIIVTLFGSKYCFVLKNREEIIVGFDVFYVNQRDIRENTVHEGYIGVSESYRNRGIATLLRRVAKQHFMSAGVSGISSIVAADNHASLRSALNVGFVVVETTAESDSVPPHHYLRLMFDGEGRG